MGMHSSDTAILYFEDVRVPQSNRIGDEGKGFMYQMMQFQEERLFATAEGIVLSPCHAPVMPHVYSGTVFLTLNVDICNDCFTSKPHNSNFFSVQELQKTYMYLHAY